MRKKRIAWDLGMSLFHLQNLITGKHDVFDNLNMTLEDQDTWEINAWTHQLRMIDAQIHDLKITITNLVIAYQNLMCT